MAGVTVSEKSGVPTVSPTLVDRTKEPLDPLFVPVMPIVSIPLGVLEAVETVRVEVPGNVVIEVGLKVQVAPEGQPVFVSATLPVKLPTAATLIVYVTLLPGVTPCEVGEAATVKSARMTEAALAAQRVVSTWLQAVTVTVE